MIYLITNRNLVKNNNFMDIIQSSVEGGVDAIILREKDLVFDELMPLALEIKRIVENSKTQLIVNTNIDVAKAIEANGIQVSFNDFMKKKYNYKGIFGISVHSLEEAIVAAQKGASYLLAGHIFETDCKKGLQPKGIEFIQDIKKNVNIPVIALGGITLDNVNEVILAGADGIAVMSSIMTSDNPYDLVLKYKQISKL